MAPRRGYLQNVYYTCMRCGTRQALSNMAWQDGILLCKSDDCIDTAIVGSRDLKVARAIGEDRRELQPDPKLVTPADRKKDITEILF